MTIKVQVLTPGKNYVASRVYLPTPPPFEKIREIGTYYKLTLCWHSSCLSFGHPSEMWCSILN